ncbi:hypothetical protein SAMN04487913_105147 [Arthrobacter sp. ok362]|nr:hypothetical protein SAMN04487913_105147 [Arthrobacter sp. ok362]
MRHAPIRSNPTIIP